MVFSEWFWSVIPFTNVYRTSWHSINDSQPCKVVIHCINDIHFFCSYRIFNFYLHSNDIINVIYRQWDQVSRNLPLQLNYILVYWANTFTLFYSNYYQYRNSINQIKKKMSYTLNIESYMCLINNSNCLYWMIIKIGQYYIEVSFLSGCTTFS